MTARPKDRYGVATYSLLEIQSQMSSIAGMHLTQSARNGIRISGLTSREALEVIQALRAEDIYKTMPCNEDWDTWQDVYRARRAGKPLYIKFQKAGRYFVISFKDL